MYKTKEQIFETLFSIYPTLEYAKESIFHAYELLYRCAVNDATVMVCGNGGSASDSEHIVGELMKGFNLMRPLSDSDKSLFENVEGGKEIADKLQYGIKAISLVSQCGLISAFANDIDASLVYAQQVFAYAKNSDDVLIALTTSGNSKNVVNAAKTAKAKGIKIIGITGESGGKLAGYCDECIKLPANTPFEVQEYTLPVYHALCAMLEAQLFKQ